MIERKFIDLKELKVSNDGPGFIEGYRSVFHEIDEGGDLIVKGFFADAIPEYMEAGFSAHSHEWAFKDAIGFPVEAREDDYGFFVRSQFHSTPDAQDIRTKARERMEAGKKVGFSFGYSVKDKTFIESKDYKDQLPQYIKADRLAANLEKAKKFDRIRILKKGEVIEDSIVTAPMNKFAGATNMKSESQPVSIKGDTESGPFGSFEVVESAIENFTQKMQSFHDIRTKEGRMLSTMNRSKVQMVMDRIMELHGHLNELMMMSEPKPKSNDGALRTQWLQLEGEVLSTLARISLKEK